MNILDSIYVTVNTSVAVKLEGKLSMYIIIIMHPFLMHFACDNYVVTLTLQTTLNKNRAIKFNCNSDKITGHETQSSNWIVST